MGMIVKECPRCETRKDHSEFGVNRAKEDGLQAYCKSCMKSYQSKRKESLDKTKPPGWKQKTADMSFYQREYRKANRERLGRIWSEWSKKHSDQIAEKGRRHYERKMKRLHGEGYVVGAPENSRGRGFLSDAERKQAYRARRVFRKAIERGKIARQPCAVCGLPDAEGHHPDYSAPLDVVWLCKSHHDETHRMHRELTSTVECCIMSVC